MFEFGDVVDALESVPEEYRTAYERNTEGKYVVKSDFKPFVAAIRGNATALAQAKKDLKSSNGESAQRRQVIKAFEELLTEQGIEFGDQKPMIDALKEHMTSLSQTAKNGTELKINLDKIKADFQKQLQAAKDEAKGENDKMRGSLERYLVSDAAKGALAAEKGSIELLLPHVKNQVKVVPEGDTYVVRVVDGSGDIRFGTTGGPMTISELVKEMKTKPDFARAFESDTKSGIGSQQQQQRQQPRPVANGDKVSSTDKIRTGLAKQQFETGGRMKSASA